MLSNGGPWSDFVSFRFLDVKKFENHRCRLSATSPLLPFRQFHRLTTLSRLNYSMLMLGFEENTTPFL